MKPEPKLPGLIAATVVIVCNVLLYVAIIAVAVCVLDGFIL